MSIKSGCEYPYYLGGIFSFSGFYAKGFTGHSENSAHTPIFAHHGLKDKTIPYDRAYNTYGEIN